MSLHPIKVLDHVLSEYRDYLVSEFRAKDPQLRAALERELDSPKFLAQEPYFQAHRPFRPGKRWRDLPIDPKLASVMEDRSDSEAAYRHQSLAIDELRSQNPKSVVVTTGTGSGKTEAFLLPVLQNALDDAAAFSKSGLTAILIYPMNALANDQRQRIAEYLKDAGLEKAISVEQYDRGTPQTKREQMRANPPHILLTNYMMLEYLLVRPADREGIFANHRCRFLVLDEVHTYRGVLGSNIALLLRRLRAHLSRARQDWRSDVTGSDREKRFPSLIPIGTSATIRSVNEEGLTAEEMIRRRDESVQAFFGDLTGAERKSICVFAEELQEISIPEAAVYPPGVQRVDVQSVNLGDIEAVRSALCQLSGQQKNTKLSDAAKGYRLLWDLSRWLTKKPMSISQLVSTVREEVVQRKNESDENIKFEVEATIVLGAALPDDVAGVLRLRAHRFIRGGWKFHRCINPVCGKLYPMGEENCAACGHVTAPLYLCRNCGADYLRFVGDPDIGLLEPSADELDGPEWLLYEPTRFEVSDDTDDDDSDGAIATPKRGQQRVPSQIKKKPVFTGSFDPGSRTFSQKEETYVNAGRIVYQLEV